MSNTNELDFNNEQSTEENDVAYVDDDNGDGEYSTSDEGVEALVTDINPDLLTGYNGQDTPIKEYVDQKIVSPYLLGGFVNGELDISQVARLSNRTSRRKLFKEIA